MKKYISNKLIKINCLNSLLNTLNENNGTSNKLFVHTANGIYIGTLKNYTGKEEIKDNDSFMAIYRKVLLKDFEELKTDKADNSEYVSENPLSIILENVEILNINNINSKITLPFIEIFIDQIIGISLGSFSDNQQD